MAIEATGLLPGSTVRDNVERGRALHGSLRTRPGCRARRPPLHREPAPGLRICRVSWPGEGGGAALPQFTRPHPPRAAGWRQSVAGEEAGHDGAQPRHRRSRTGRPSCRDSPYGRRKHSTTKGTPTWGAVPAPSATYTYSHLSPVLVAPGQQVVAGHQIGLTGGQSGTRGPVAPPAHTYASRSAPTANPCVRRPLFLAALIGTPPSRPANSSIHNRMHRAWHADRLGSLA